jgi:hypothetical protein
MSIVYLGNEAQNFHEQPGATWSQTLEKLDVRHVTYAGAKSLADLWESKNPRGVTLLGYPKMHLVNYNIEFTRSYFFARCEFVGVKRKGLVFPTVPNRDRRLAIKTVSNSTQSPEPATMNVTYYSPEVIFRYATDREVLAAQFSPSGVASFALSDIRKVVKTDAGKTYAGTVPISLFVALTMPALWRVVGFASTKIDYAPYWNNEEVWAYEYVPSSE